MFKTITPEQAGISSRAILNFVKTLEEYHLATHTILMARGNDIFAECYYAPFNKDFKHRMYSVSKSFVAVAIGLLEEEGKLSLDEKVIDHFPEMANNENLNDLLKEQTIRDMLKMTTSHHTGCNRFSSGTKDRRECYFATSGERHTGTIFNYDSPGSYMMNCIVEQITGKPFLEYMKDRFLRAAGFSEDAYCIQAPGGYSFGDSGVMCTGRDLLTFCRFVANYGTWDGVRYMNEDFLKTATTKLVDNSSCGFVSYGNYGYGYQIWKAPRDGFAFVGMGDQFAIYDPKTDFIFVINSDNQGNAPVSRAILYHCLYKDIVEKLGTPLPEDPEAYKELTEYLSTRELYHYPSESISPFAEKISGVTYTMDENQMGIKTVRFDFAGDKGTMTYENEQGVKTLTLGFGHNEYQKFPQEGYSDLIATYPEPGHMYDCAVSAAWTEEKKLHIKVQIIDKYFGVLDMVFGFKNEDLFSVQMVKTAEAFLDEYQGIANGKAVQ